MHQVGRRRDPRIRKCPTFSRQRTTIIKPPRKAPSTHSAWRDARRTGAAVSWSSSDEVKESAGRARVLQRRGRARVREQVKMVESMPVETKRPSALETKSVTRKTLKVHAASVREFCDWSGLLADSIVEALEVDRPAKFMNLYRGWKGNKLLASILFFSDFLAAEEKKTFFELFQTTAPGGSLERSGRGNVQWYAGALYSPWSCSKLISDLGKCCHSNLRASWLQRRVESEAGGHSDWYREKQNWRGRHDQSQLKNDVYGWCQCSRGFSDDSHRTSLCST